MDYRTMKSVLEGLLFVAGDEGIPLKTAAEIVGADPGVVRDVLDDLAREYVRDQRGLRVAEVAGAYRLTTAPEHAPYFEKLAVSPMRSVLSQAALETLAIVAYRQPITRVEIEEIRGVNSDRAIQSLLAKDLIEEKGRADTVGRPILYGTTRAFLDWFGLSGLDQLPDPGLHESGELAERTRLLFERAEDRQLSLEDLERALELERE
ncbi:MAG TPA: SMC-Scp complex subunit ScpB [Paenibacillaceae bacterium]